MTMTSVLKMVRRAAPAASLLAVAGLLASAEARQVALTPPPPTTAHGALLNHITGGHIEVVDAGPRSFQPMNINFGLFPPLVSPPTHNAEGKKLRGPEKSVARKQALSARALADLDAWIAQTRTVREAA